MSKKWLNIKQLSKKVGDRGRNSIYRDVERGFLPKPLQMGSRGRVLWDEDEVDAYLLNMASQTFEKKQIVCGEGKKRGRPRKNPVVEQGV